MISTSFHYREPRVAIQITDGDIFVAYCTCKAKEGGQCCHVGCLLFMIEEIKFGCTPLIDDACTSKSQAWGKGAVRNVEPQAINKVNTI